MESRFNNCFLCNESINGIPRIPLVGSLSLASDIAQLIEGHSLIYTNNHTLSFAHASKLEIEELIFVLDRLHQIPYFSETELFLFEHGPGPDGSSIAGCCDHAHIHILPLISNLQNIPSLINCEISSYVESKHVRQLPELKLSEISELITENYIWYGVDINHLKAFSIENVPRQFLRKLIANANGESSFQSWERYDKVAALQLTKLLRTQLSDIDIFDQVQERSVSENER